MFSIVSVIWWLLKLHCQTHHHQNSFFWLINLNAGMHSFDDCNFLFLILIFFFLSLLWLLLPLQLNPSPKAIKREYLFFLIFISFIMKFIFHKRCKTLIYDSCDIRWLRFWLYSYITLRSSLSLSRSLFCGVPFVLINIYSHRPNTKCIFVLCYMRIFISGAAIHMHMWKK